MEGVRERPTRPANQSQTQVQNQELSTVSQLSEEAHLYVTQGLTCDEQGQSEQAKILYEKALHCMSKAMAVTVSSSNPQYSIIKTKREKMRGTQQQLQDRLNHLVRTDPDVQRAMSDPPPSYEASTTPTQESTSMATALSMDSISSASSSRRGSLTANATEIYKIDNGVQIFFITPEGYVSAPSYPSDLSVMKFTEAQHTSSDAETPPAFLKVGDWTYPLFPGSSPVLHANWGAYIFPDTDAQVSGSAVGVIIPDNVSENQRNNFEQTLKDLTALRTQAPSPSSSQAPPRPAPPRQAPPRQAPPRQAPPKQAPPRQAPPRQAPPSYVAEEEPGPKPCGPRERTQDRDEGSERTSAKVAKGLVTAAEWITWGLEKGAEQTEKLLKHSSTKLQQNIQPDAEQSKIDPRAQKGAHYVRVGAGAAVKVSKYVVDKLGQATMHLAREAAPHVKKQGEKLLPKSMVSKEEGGRSKLDDVAEVAAGGLQGFATVYNALESAAKTLAKSLSDETVKVVHHKYGGEAGQFTEDTLHAVGNVGVTVYNANHLGVKAIAKRAAKDTGKAMIEDMSGQRLDENGGAAKRAKGRGAEVVEEDEEEWVVTGGRGEEERMEVVESSSRGGAVGYRRTSEKPPME